MKRTHTPTRRRSGFTLIEMIGVLAIIAVLAALLIPRIFSAINESRVNGAALSYNSLKSAAITYFGKYGRFGDATGAAYADTTGVTNWDTSVLLAGGFIEKPFETKLGTASNIQIVDSVASTTAADATNASYNLDGAGTANDATGAVVLQAVLFGVAEDDARELNNKIDGTTLGTTTGSDLAGRVKYAAATSGVTDVYVYIAHK